MSDFPSILPSQLCPGLYVILDLPWERHSFFESEFKIRTEVDLRALRALQLDKIHYDPDRSDATPLRLVADVWLNSDPEHRREEMTQRRTAVKRCEKSFMDAASKVRESVGKLRAQPKEAVEEAIDVVHAMVDTLLGEDGALLQVVNTKSKEENSYFHSINVSSLSLMLGQTMGLSKEELQSLGVGALLHDLGHSELPGKILRKKGELTKAERHLYNKHPVYGRKIADKTGLERPVREIISGHHEMMDGSGYPKGIEAGKLSLATRIVAVINAYDNLCNPVDPTRSKTPFEAMAYLYRRAGKKFDTDVVINFIASMGVYPPGTVVRLSDDSIGMVLNVNPDALLRPWVIIYDPSVPREEALIIDLTQEGVEVKESIPYEQLADEVKDYLNVQKNLNYFIESKGNTK